MCLTEHPYKEWEYDFPECCDTDPDNPGCTECCYDDWQKQWKTVNQDYAKALEDYNQAQNKWTVIYTRRNTYKTWLDELDKAGELAEDICNQLELIALQSDKIWHNACKAAKAIEILFCMLKDFFTQLDYLATVYNDLQTCIAKNNDSSLVKGQGILKYLDEYKAKLDIVLKVREDILKSITDAVKLANLITNYISTKDCCHEDNCYDPCAANQKPCKPGNEAHYGFKTVICEWYNAFGCDDCGNNNSGCSDEEKDDCKDDKHCKLNPNIQLPLCKNHYRNTVYQRYTDDDTALKSIREELETTKKKKESLGACKASLEIAIKAVDPKERCK